MNQNIDDNINQNIDHDINQNIYIILVIIIHKFYMWMKFLLS